MQKKVYKAYRFMPDIKHMLFLYWDFKPGAIYKYRTERVVYLTLIFVYRKCGRGCKTFQFLKNASAIYLFNLNKTCTSSDFWMRFSFELIDRTKNEK